MEAKFRGWDKEQGLMLCWNELCRIFYNINWYVDNDNEAKMLTMFTDPDIETMLCSGLPDIKGEEIYRGDVLEGEAPRGEVKFGVFDNVKDGPEHDCGVGFYLETRDGIQSLSRLLVDVYKYEVIGNIFENPKLINRGK